MMTRHWTFLFVTDDVIQDDENMEQRESRKHSILHVLHASQKCNHYKVY